MMHLVMLLLNKLTCGIWNYDITDSRHVYNVYYVLKKKIKLIAWTNLLVMPKIISLRNIPKMYNWKLLHM